jgi:hypothetical protein
MSLCVADFGTSRDFHFLRKSGQPGAFPSGPPSSKFAVVVKEFASELKLVSTPVSVFLLGAVHPAWLDAPHEDLLLGR